MNIWGQDTVIFSKLLDMQIQMQQLIDKQQQIQQQHEKQLSLSSVKLPKIEIPLFDGNKMKWIEFWNRFEVFIDSKENLSGVEKMYYVKNKLTAKARNAVEGLILSNKNYNLAVSLLKERFGDPQNIANSFYTELINLTPATSCNESLRYLYDSIVKNLRGLEAIEQDINQEIFTTIIKSKIPTNVLIQLETQKGLKPNGQ